MARSFDSTIRLIMVPIHLSHLVYLQTGNYCFTRGIFIAYVKLVQMVPDGFTEANCLLNAC